MKVNIQYSIELDEIPNKVKEFLMKAAQESSEIEAGIRYAISLMDDNISIDEQLKRIDLVRRKMADVDYILLDSSEILHGYQKTLVQIRGEPELPDEGLQPNVNMHPEDASKAIDLENYSKQLKKLDETMNHIRKEYHDDETRNEKIKEG